MWSYNFFYTGLLRTNNTGNNCSQIGGLLHNYEEGGQPERRDPLRHPFQVHAAALTWMVTRLGLGWSLVSAY